MYARTYMPIGNTIKCNEIMQNTKAKKGKIAKLGVDVVLVVLVSVRLLL